MAPSTRRCWSRCTSRMSSIFSSWKTRRVHDDQVKALASRGGVLQVAEHIGAHQAVAAQVQAVEPEIAP